jgi:hypothetical protein
MNSPSLRYLYEAGVPLSERKHHWNRAEAGVARWRTIPRVGKCDARITDQIAEQLLNNGLPYYEDTPPPRGKAPDRIYAVWEGAPYEARATREGISFHGYPVIPERFDRLPSSVRHYLETAATAQGKDVHDWLKKWPRP